MKTIMDILPEVEQISAFKNNQSVVLEKVKSGPVLLMQRSKPVVVMVSPEEWNAAAKRIKQLEEQLEQHQGRVHSSQWGLEIQNVSDSAIDGDSPHMKKSGSSNSQLRPFGLCAGEFTVPDNFDEPLPNDILDLFEGT